MNDPNVPHPPAGATELAAERDRLETSPAMPADADRVEPAGDDATDVHVKHDHATRMNH